MGDAPKVTIMKDHGHGQWPSARVLLAGSGVVVIIIVGVWLVVAHNHSKKEQAVKANNTEIAALVSQAGPYLEQSEVSSLAPIAAKLKQQTGCVQNVDCLFVLTTFYINSGDVQNAQAYYNKLIAVYNPDKGYANTYLKKAKTPTQLKTELGIVEQADADAKSHFFAGSTYGDGK